MFRTTNALFLALFTTILLCANLLAHAQQPPNGETTAPETQAPAPEHASPPPAQAQSATPAANPVRIAAGSVIPVELAKSIDAKKAKTGDEVVAKVTKDLRNNAGTVLMPKDTKVIGHITEAQARTKEQKESQLAIAFDKAVLKNGEEMEMPMSIQAIIAPPNLNNASNSQASPSYPPPATSGSETSGAPSSGSRPGTMEGNAQPPSAMPQTTNNGSTASQAQAPITANTQGVVGIANLNLAAAPGATEGSLVTSEKNNVKLEDGTFLLLRVKQ
jgi:Bacterial conjugation TrbI-like protein